ncbi:hypothetical protein EJ03DRAFT_354982 [Teratosphaeria nubilosa]|uniref:MFS general substrate transporter n=1 Tax=Teratosphaeria nubilosa TaxID=161662 RepID=A0A6G1KXH3_9PEZI|nr:hypothetical protein EJ03DRAFT_354982 [Teratosphaeria nubilosa]
MAFAFSALGGALLAQAAGIQNVVIATVVLNGLALICCMACVGDRASGRLVDVKQTKNSLETSQLRPYHIPRSVTIVRTSSGFAAIRVVTVVFEYYLVTLAGPNQKRSGIEIAVLLLVMHAPMGLGHQYGELVNNYGAEPCALMGSAFAAILVSIVSCTYARLRQGSTIVGLAMALASFGLFSNLYQTALFSDLTKKMRNPTAGEPVLRMSPIEIIEFASALGTSLGPGLAFAPAAGTLAMLSTCLSITIFYMAYKRSSRAGRAPLVEPDQEASNKGSV